LKGAAGIGLALSHPDDDGLARFALAMTIPSAMMDSTFELREAHYLGAVPASSVYLQLDKIFTFEQHDAVELLARLTPQAMADVHRKIIALEIRNFWPYAHSPQPFVPNESTIPYSGRVFGVEELEILVESALDFWLTTGRFNEAFEEELSRFLGVEHVLTTNSGSSANLLAVAALTSPKLGDRRLKPGDEVITVAAAFPTTVNPIIHYGMVPVFVDVDIPTYNIRREMVEAAVSERTRAIMLAHTLGNPFDLREVLRVAKKYDLWVIEDCCDALGSTYFLDEEARCPRLVGGFGHLSTFSFYAAHHITMGEGGAVATRDVQLKRIVESLRDWGRDCWCSTGRDNTCKRRFDWQLGGLPKGYDHKFTYSHVGYNLKITDMQAAVGVAQLSRLEAFIKARRSNFRYLRERLSDLEDCLILPEATPGSDPSWFGFCLTLRGDRQGQRQSLLKHLDSHRIGSRLLFGGNLIKQPYFQGQPYRVLDPLENTNTIMNDTFWIGVYPGLDESRLEFVAEVLQGFFR
jgi:CDP-6-deoxy-D-xylo-4-hexulose-3-dehydrase